MDAKSVDANGVAPAGTDLEGSSFLFGANSAFIKHLYQRYLNWSVPCRHGVRTRGAISYSLSAAWNNWAEAERIMAWLRRSCDADAISS